MVDNPGGNMDTYARDVVAPDLDLARVNTRSQLQPEVLGTGQDVGRTAKCSPGGVEGGQEAVPGSSTYFAPRMWAARWRPCSTRTNRSPTRCSTTSGLGPH